MRYHVWRACCGVAVPRPSSVTTCSRLERSSAKDGPPPALVRPPPPTNLAARSLNRRTALVRNCTCPPVCSSPRPPPLQEAAPAVPPTSAPTVPPLPLAVLVLVAAVEVARNAGVAWVRGRAGWGGVACGCEAWSAGAPSSAAAKSTCCQGDAAAAPAACVPPLAGAGGALVSSRNAFAMKMMCPHEHRPASASAAPHAAASSAWGGPSRTSLSQKGRCTTVDNTRNVTRP